MNGDCVITWQIAQHAHGCRVCEAAEADREARVAEIRDRLLNSEVVTLKDGTTIGIRDLCEYITDMASFHTDIMPALVSGAVYEHSRQYANVMMFGAAMNAAKALAEECADDYRLGGGE